MKKIGIILLFVLSGCVGPKHKVPHHTMPERFDYQQTALQTTDHLQQWWRTFQDPVLNDLINQAIRYNYNLRLAIEKIEEFRAFYQIKQAELFPQLDVISEVNRTKFSSALAQNSFLQERTLSFFQLGFDAFWEIDFWGKIWHAKNARYFAMQAQIEEMRDVYLVLLADVARSYIDICALTKKIHLLQKRIHDQHTLVTLQKDLLCAGLTDKISVDQQEQQLATSYDLLKTLHNDLNQNTNQLAILLGKNPEDITIAGTNAVPFSHAELATGIPSDLLRRRPDIRRAERLLASSNALVGQAIAEYFPSFTLLAGVSSASSTGKQWFTGDSLMWSIGPSIRWPIINFGRIRAHIRTQQSVKKQAILAYSQTIISALKEVEDVLSSYFLNKEQLEILHAKLKYATDEHQLTNDKYTSGLANALDVLNTDINRINIALEITEREQSLSTNLVALYKALGGGW